jgi:hypothetical protein
MVSWWYAILFVLNVLPCVHMHAFLFIAETVYLHSRRCQTFNFTDVFFLNDDTPIDP